MFLQKIYNTVDSVVVVRYNTDVGFLDPNVKRGGTEKRTHLKEK